MCMVWNFLNSDIIDDLFILVRDLNVLNSRLGITKVLFGT